jgi:PAS domain S-box-containing protein
MMNVGIGEAQRRLPEILDRVHRDKQRIAVWNGERPLAVLVPIENLDLIEDHGDPAAEDGAQRLNDFAETASGWFWETDMEQRYTYYSGAGPGNEVMGRDDSQCASETMIGRTVSEAWGDYQDLEPDLIETITEYMTRGEPFRDLEFSYRDPKRGLVNITLSGKPVADDQGHVVAYRGTGRDITERTKAVRELIAAKERAVAAEAELEEALEAMSEGFTYFDAEDRLIRCNSKHRELFPSHAEFMVPGIRFEDLLRKQAQNIRLPWAVGREEEWVAERVAQHRNPGAPIEQKFADGRVIRLSEYKTRSGGVVSIRTDITELKRAEEEARDSRDRIRLIADNLPASVTYFDTEQRFRFANRTAQEWYARSVEELLGRTILEIIGPEAHDRLSANLEAALSGEAQRFEKDRAYPDGKPRVVEISYVPHFDEDGKVQGCFALVNDITERKRAEQALQESEALFRAFIDNLPSEILIRDAQGRFVLVNRAWERAQGMESARAIGLRVHDVFPKDRADRFAAQDRTVLESGQALDEEVEFQSRDGYRALRTIKFPVPDASGKVAAIGGIAINISKRRRAEIALQQSEERFRDFAEAASDWFWETDAEHRFSWLSARVEDVTGVPAEFHIGKSRLELAADRAERDKWRAHLETLEARRPFRDFRYLRRGHDGRLQHMSSSGVPVFDAEGKFKGYRGTGTDISAEVKAEEMAAGAQERFMAAIESVSDGFALFDANDQMVFCNSHFKAMNPDLAPKLVPGVTFEELLRDNIAANRILDALGEEEAFVRERMERHRGPSGPLVQQRRDGRWLELREERTPEGSTFLVNTDITERKQAEEALRESEARLSKATEMAKIGYWVWDEVEDKAIYCSEELAKMYGVASGADLAAMLTSHAADLEWVHPDDRERFDEVVRTAKETKRGYDFEYRIINAKGEVRHLRELEEPVTDQRGDIIRTNGVTHDITDQKRVEEEIRKLNAELEQRVEERTAELREAQSELIRQERLATLGQLTATVSHELRNPLGVIRTSAFVVR